MKKSILAIAVLGAFAGVAQAQTNVTIYGVIDIAAYYAENQYNQDPLVGAPAQPYVAKLANGSAMGLTNSGESMSRIGFTGSEDLGNGLKAVFTLENRFLPNNGAIVNGVGSVANVVSSAKPQTTGGDSSLDGQLFNGQANAGFSSNSFGTLVLGRVISLSNDTIGNYDSQHASLMFSPLGYSGQYGGIGFTENARFDNAIKYTNKAGDFNYGALYKFGGQSGAPNAQTAEELTLGYSSGPFSIQGTLQRVNDGVSVGAGGVNEVALTFADTQGVLIGANYQLDKFALYGGVEYFTDNTPSNPGVDAATSTLYGYTVASVNTTLYAHERKENVYWAGLTYHVAPPVDLSVAYYYVHQNDYSGGLCAASDTAASFCAGNTQYLSLMADYTFSKRTDVYAGYMFNRVRGGYDVVGTIHDTDNFFGAGMRLKF